MFAGDRIEIARQPDSAALANVAALASDDEIVWPSNATESGGNDVLDDIFVGGNVPAILAHTSVAVENSTPHVR